VKKLLLILRSIFKNRNLNAIVTISMGLGLVTAGIILSYVYQEFHYDAGNKNSEHVFRINQGAGNYGPLAETLKSNFPEIEKAARVAFFYGYLACSAGENKFNETSAIFADPTFFELFSFPLVEGDSKTCLTDPNSIVLSERAALKYFNNSSPIGKQIKIGSNHEFTITGVFENFKTNSNFRGDLIVPLEKISRLTQIWIEPSWKHGSDIHTFILLNQHTNINELADKTDKLVSQFTRESLDSHVFQSLKDIHIENQYGWESTSQANLTYLHILIGVAILILCIAGSNFIFLFVGIKSQQKTGAGIRKICGASKSTLFLEYFTEVLLLMGLSVLVAVIFYTFYHAVAKDYFEFLPRILFFDFNLILILFSVVSGVALLSGLYPALALSSQIPVRIFSSQNIDMPGKIKFVNKLVIVQFALCISLIVGTMIMHNQVHYIENRNTGYAKDELITIPLNMHVGNGINNEKFGAFAEELKKYPGVKNVSMAFSSPSSVLTGAGTPDWQGKPEGKEVQMHWESVSYDYFETIGVQIAQGRSFSPDFPADMINWDNHTGAYILNKSAVQAMELEDPIGKEFGVWGFKGPIIGVVDDYNFKSMHSAITPMFYMANPFFLNEIVVRINPKSATVLTDIKTVWDQFVPQYPLEFHFVSDKVRELYYSDKNLANSLNLFSFLAIVIASMGLFALTLLSTNQRTKEIGVRKVVGASIANILIALTKDFIKWVLYANLIAWPLSWFIMNKWLQNFAYRIDLTVWPFLLAGLSALAIAVLTVSWQAMRAATANPVEALRYE
jgi:putative ABC transport system permease protein